MAQEFAQIQEKNPIIQSQTINSTARGSENIAKVLGEIAERSINKATNYAAEASKANLLQTHGMLQDIEAQSKIEIARSPEHAESIAKNAEQSVNKIKSSASLNRADRLNLDAMAQNTVRGLSLTAAEKSIALTREQAKFRALSTFGDTLQSIRQNVFSDPESADKLIDAQYSALTGQVRAGIITAVEAENLHKQMVKELELSHELLSAMKEGILGASDLSAMHATDSGTVPLSNANLPINHNTAMNSDHYYGQLTMHDIQSKFANGERVLPKDLIAIKKPSDLNKVLNYGAGAARATGDINSGTSWIELKDKLNVLKKKQKLSLREEGYKNRLNNFFNEIERPGYYQNYIAGMPEGARMYQAFAQKNAAIDKEVLFGSEQEVAHAKSSMHIDNLNDLISKSALLGHAMHYPDNLIQPIPTQYLTPIVNSFNKDGDIASAINNIQMLSPKNRAYALNAFPKNYRKQLTVLEVGALGSKADAGFLVDLMQSQQVDALGEKPGKKDAQEKFLQLAKGKEGFSDEKLRARIMPQLTSITSYLEKQPNGTAIVSAKTDQVLRYVKDQAAKHNDFQFKNLDDYINTYQTNMDKAYGVKTGFNYVVSGNDIPLDEGDIQLLASHSINDVRQKLLEYRSEAQVANIFQSTPPILVSSPGGRMQVVFPNGQMVPDKYGHPAFNELYTESLWRSVQHENEKNPDKAKQSLFLF